MVLDKAILLWDQADVLSKSIIRLKQDLTQIPENPKLQLNKKAIESSLLDAQDQLDEKVYEVLQKAQKLYGKSASILSDNAAGMVERAEDVLEETSQSFNHLVKVVQQRIKKFKGCVYIETHCCLNKYYLIVVVLLVVCLYVCRITHKCLLWLS